MGSRAFKDSLYAEFAVLGKALANPHRLEILDLLGQGERSVEQLAREAELSLANASAHLQVLRRARLVEAEKRGLNVVYRLAAPEVYGLWRTLRDVASARLTEIERLVENYFTDREELEAVDREVLLRLMDGGTVTVIDVRPEVEYEQGHICGALRPGRDPQATAGRAAPRCGGRGLLPRPVLRLLRRGRPAASPAWLQGQAPLRGFPGVAGRGLSSRDARTGRDRQSVTQNKRGFGADP